MQKGFKTKLLVEEDEGSYRPKSQTNLDLVFVHSEMYTLFWYFIYATVYHLGRYKPLSTSTYE